MKKLNLKKVVFAAFMLASLTSNVFAIPGWKKNNGDTELHKAVKKLNVEKAIGLCVTNPGLVDTPNNAGETPLHLLAKMEFYNSAEKNAKVLRIMSYLIFNANANVNMQDKNGDSPLHFVYDSEFGYKGDQALLLLMGGALVDIKNNKGWTIGDKLFEKNSNPSDVPLIYTELACLLYFDKQILEYYKDDLDYLKLLSQAEKFTDQDFIDCFNKSTRFKFVVKIISGISDLDFDLFLEKRNIFSEKYKS